MTLTRRYTRPTVLTALTLFVASMSFLLVHRIIFAQGRVAFTATTRQVVYYRSGKVFLTEMGLFAVRSDSSTTRVRYVSVPSNHGVVIQRTLHDLARAEEVFIDELTESTTTTPLRTDAVTFYKRPSTCTTQAAPPHQNMLGFDVVRDVQRVGARLREEWRAAALDCYALKQTLSLGATDADLYISNVHEVVQISEGEPAAWLFARPANYIERPPSQRTKELLNRYPDLSCPSCVKESDSADDEAYYRRQADKGK
jgi:hypothetical protein